MREFFITNTGNEVDDAYREFLEAKDACEYSKVKEIIHVVEYSALAKAEARIEKLREAMSNFSHVYKSDFHRNCCENSMGCHCSPNYLDRAIFEDDIAMKEGGGNAKT